MTYKESLKIAFLKTDSEEGDYDRDIFPILAHEAQTYVAKYGTHIKKVLKISATEVPSKVKLPDNFYRVAPMGLVFEDNISIGGKYAILEDGYISIFEKGDFLLNYYALPDDITKMTESQRENYEYQAAEHTHAAIPCYIGYQLVKSDDVALAQVLLNEWNKYMSLFNDNEKTFLRRLDRR